MTGFSSEFSILLLNTTTNSCLNSSISRKWIPACFGGIPLISFATKLSSGTNRSPHSPWDLLSLVDCHVSSMLMPNQYHYGGKGTYCFTCALNHVFNSIKMIIGHIHYISGDQTAKRIPIHNFVCVGHIKIMSFLKLFSVSDTLSRTLKTSHSTSQCIVVQ